MPTETIHNAALAYLNHLHSEGKKERSIYTYSKDLEQIERFFGGERRLSSILAPQVSQFIQSDILLKLPNGEMRAEPTIEKTKRCLRMFLVWAKNKRLIDTLPLPDDYPMGRSVVEGDQRNDEYDRQSTEPATQ